MTITKHFFSLTLSNNTVRVEVISMPVKFQYLSLLLTFLYLLWGLGLGLCLYTCKKCSSTLTLTPTSECVLAGWAGPIRARNMITWLRTDQWERRTGMWSWGKLWLCVTTQSRRGTVTWTSNKRFSIILHKENMKSLQISQLNTHQWVIRETDICIWFNLQMQSFTTTPPHHRLRSKNSGAMMQPTFYNLTTTSAGLMQRNINFHETRCSTFQTWLLQLPIVDRCV